MLFYDVICYAVLTITVTIKCVEAEYPDQEVAETKNHMTKRDATMLIDNFPIDAVYQKPKVIYRRVSSVAKHRYGPSKPKYGPPIPKYRPKITRKPGKKYAKHSYPKYRASIYKRRTAKPVYGSPKRHKPVYGPPRRKPQHLMYSPKPAGFAEPPVNDFQKPKREKQEDSYGVPIKTTLKDPYPILQSLKSNKHYEIDDLVDLEQDNLSWKNAKGNQNADTFTSYSNQHPIYMKYEPEKYVTTVTLDANEANFKSYSDLLTYREHQKMNIKKEKNKKPYYSNNAKLKTWNPQQPDIEEEIIVGGQYAEPPARYMAKFEPTSADDDDFAPPQSFIDSEILSSVSTSPYVNYKNSNVAFNPQNLNDAFGIVE